MDKELMDVYDENKNLTGKNIYRKDMDTLKENEYIITSHCFIINSSNQILLTQRSLNTDRKGKWEDTHGGVKAGETSIDAIIRELKEEIGINVKPSELKLIKTIKKKNAFRDIYILKKDVALESLILNKNEVMDCKYVTINEFKEMIEKEECTFTSFKQTIFYDNNINFLRKD